MSRLFEILRSIYGKIDTYFGFQNISLDEKLKRLLAISAAAIITPVLLVFGFLHLHKGDSFLGWFLILGGLIFTISVLIIPKIVNVISAIRVDLVFGGCLFIYLLAVSGPLGHMAAWLYVLPPALFFMLGLREGLIFSAIFLIAALLVLLLQGFLPNTVPLDPDFSLRFFISLFLVTFIAFFYEFVRNSYLKEIEKKQSMLEEEKQNLTSARRVAEKANQSKSEFLANMSHELRTPLNHIIGFTELVTDQAVGPLNANQEEYLNDVLGSSRHLLSLINDILDLSKIEAGKMELELSEIAFQTLLENSTVMIKEKAMNHRIGLTTRFLAIPPAIRADERKLKQILYNLLSNAVKFTPDGGTVLLEARGLDGREVEITVSDTGIGVPEADLERIFQPFEQADNSASRKFQGTGLGLSLTRKMVELHGGRIWVESEGAGRGSHFHVHLPLQEKQYTEG